MHWHLADCYRTTKQPVLQEAEYLKAIEAFIDSENKYFLGQAYVDLGNLHYGARRYEQSKTFFKLAIPVLQDTQRTDRMPFVKYRLAGIERNTGNPQAALALADEAITLAKFAGDVTAIRENQIELALINSDLGNSDTAIGILDELIQDNDETPKNRSAAKAMYYRATSLSKTGQLREAAEWYERALPLLEIVDQKDLAINAHLALIHIRTSNGEKVD